MLLYSLLQLITASRTTAAVAAPSTASYTADFATATDAAPSTAAATAFTTAARSQRYRC